MKSFRTFLGRLDGGYLRLCCAAVIVALFIASLRRSVPWVPCVAGAAVLAFVWTRLPRRIRPVRAYAIEAALMSVSIAVCIAVAEIALRQVLPPSWGPIRFVQPDAEYNVLSKPGSRGWIGITGPAGKSEEFYFAQFSSQGFRDREYGPKAAEEIRVLMLGDSFTMGHVEEQDSIPRQLEKICAQRLPGKTIHIVNAGLGNTGPLEQLGMLRKRGLAIDPDLVVLQSFPSNDIQDCLSAEGRWLPVAPRWTQFDVQRWRRVVDGSIPFAVDRALHVRSAVYHVIATRTEHRAPLAAWLEDFRFFTQYPPIRLEDAVNRPPHLEPDLANWYPELAQGFDLFKRNVLQIRDECASHGIVFRAYCLPVKYDLFDDLWKTETAAVTEPYERMKACRVVREFFDEAGIEHASVDEAIVAAGPAENVFYPYDGHLNAEGNRVVAQRLFETVITPFIKELDAKRGTGPEAK